MNIQELEDKHKELMVDSTSYTDKKHTKLSVEFAIKMLQELERGRNFYQPIRDKIDELKQYLDEE